MFTAQLFTGCCSEKFLWLWTRMKWMKQKQNNKH